MKDNISGLKAKTAEDVQRLLREGSVSQSDITEALYDFYTGRYPDLDPQSIMDFLNEGLG